MVETPKHPHFDTLKPPNPKTTPTPKPTASPRKDPIPILGSLNHKIPLFLHHGKTQTSPFQCPPADEVSAFRCFSALVPAARLGRAATLRGCQPTAPVPGGLWVPKTPLFYPKLASGLHSSHFKSPHPTPISPQNHLISPQIAQNHPVAPGSHPKTPQSHPQTFWSYSKFVQKSLISPQNCPKSPNPTPKPLNTTPKPHNPTPKLADPTPKPHNQTPKLADPTPNGPIPP